MLKSEGNIYRLTADTVARIAELGRRWGSVAPVSPSDVIAECVKRVRAAELGLATVTRTRKEPTR